MTCEHCHAPIKVASTTQKLRTLGAANEHYNFRLCLLISVPARCPKCDTPISLEQLQERLPVDALIAEGAKLMSARNPNRFTKDSGAAAARKRFHKNG